MMLLKLQSWVLLQPLNLNDYLIKVHLRVKIFKTCEAREAEQKRDSNSYIWCFIWLLFDYRLPQWKEITDKPAGTDFKDYEHGHLNGVM